MCIASVRDCKALAAAQPVDVTRARIPWFINSHAGQEKEEKQKRDVKKNAELSSGFTVELKRNKTFQTVSKISITSEPLQEGSKSQNIKGVKLKT